jgi:metal-sulfur cluster biosynthetic enzyme
MSNSEQLRTAILQKLATVIDPETGVDVVRMRLIEDLKVDDEGRVSYKFRPSSFLCPLAVPLSLEIQRAVAEVEGTTDQNMEIVGYVQANELTALIRRALLAKFK